MIGREPENPADSNALAVMTIAGESLGYIPRHLTDRFVFPVTLGFVESKGQAGGNGLLGAWPLSVSFDSKSLCVGTWANKNLQ